MLRRRWVCLECVRVRACVRTKQLINRARAFTDAASSAFYAFIKFRVRVVRWVGGGGFGDSDRVCCFVCRFA